MSENAIDQLEEMLSRIEKQNEQILALLTKKANRKYVPLEEAAERFNRAVWTLRRLCSMGRIRAIKDGGGHWRIPAEEMARLEEEGIPKFPTKTPSSSQPSLPRGKGAGSAASWPQSRGPSTSI